MALAAIKYRAYPTPEQAEFFQRTFGCVRKIWNCLLADSNEYHKLNKKHHVNYESQYKSVYPYLKDVDSLALSNARLQLQTAYNRFFEKKSGFPKFKSKHKSKRSYTTNNQGNTVALLDTGVKLDTIALDIIQLVDSTKGHVRVYEKKEPTEENYKKLLRIVKGIAEKEAVDIISSVDSSNISEKKQDMNDLIERMNNKYDLNNCPVSEEILSQYAESYNKFQNSNDTQQCRQDGNCDSKYGVCGTVAPMYVDDNPAKEKLYNGGAAQYNTPCSIETFTRLGVFRDDE